MQLRDIAATLEGFAEEVFEAGKAEFMAVAQTVEPIAEDAFVTLVNQLGKLAVQTVMDMFKAEFNHLSGMEKANLAATTIVDNALAQGISLIDQDATALVKNAYIAVKAQLANS